MKELIYHRQFLPAMRMHRNKVGVIDGDYRATFAEHLDRVLRLASSLGSELGIGKGDRFAVLGLNSHQYLELYHAAYLGVGIINPLNIRLAAPELNYILRDSGSEVVFVDQTFFHLLQQALHEQEQPTTVEKVVLIGPGDFPDCLSFENLIATGKAEIPPEPEEEDPVVLMYTGGTTGLPKGVLVSQRAETLNTYHVGMRFARFDPEQVTLLQTPIFHAASMVTVLSTPSSGATLVLVPMFEPSRVLDMIEEHQVTVTAMVPTMVAMVLNHDAFEPSRLSSLESLTYGASPMPAALLDKLLELFPDMDISQGYGMTESSSVLTFLGPEEHREGSDRVRSVGRPVTGVELCIRGEDGNDLEPGQYGEVCARGGNLMTEYWNQPEQTRQALGDGWYHTGDAGYLDEDGYLYLVDRVKDMIVTGGENVYSVEVENAISSHPAVAQVAVIGIPDDTWGELVHAVVVPHPNQEITEDDIISHSRKTVAGYKVPKSVEFRSQPLPLSGAMKVLKRELRKPHWEGRDRNI